MELELKRYHNGHSFGSKLMRAIWSLTWLLLARWTPSRMWVFNGWRLLLLRIFGANIGKNCVVLSSCQIWQPWKLSLGDWVALDEHVFCYTVAPISIGNQTTISRETFLCGASHDISNPTMRLIAKPITIGANAWIAARSIVLPGIAIGDGAVVGAGSVVSKSVPAWKVVAGNPLRVLRDRKLLEDIG